MSDVDILSLQESSQIDELLKKLLLLSERIIEVRERYVVHLLMLPNVFAHEDVIEQLSDRTNDVKDLARVIAEDSIIVTDIARQVKEQILRRHRLPDESGLMPEQTTTFMLISELEPKLNEVNDLITYCLLSIEEIRNHDKNIIAAQDTVHVELTVLNAKMQELLDKIKTLSSAMSHLSHMNHQCVHQQMQQSLTRDVLKETEDMEHLKAIFLACHHRVAILSKDIWEAKGRETAATQLQQHVLPLFQKALAYDGQLEQAIVQLRSKNTILARYQVSLPPPEMQQMEALTGTIRNLYASFNAKTVPSLIQMLRKGPTPQLNEAFKQVIAVFAGLYQRVDRVEKLVASLRDIEKASNPHIQE